MYWYSKQGDEKMNPAIEKIMENIKKGEKVTIWFDIDGTLADTDSNLKYDEAIPDMNMIKLCNWLYDQGHEIYVCTGRGAGTGIDWAQETKEQLKRWGAKYHKLIMGYRKDLVIDDVSMRPDEIFRELL